MEASKPVGVLDRAASPAPKVITNSNPTFVTRYIKVRQKLDDLEVERRDLEEEISGWGEQQILSGETTGMKLPLKGSLAKKAELSLYSKKPTEKQALAHNTELRQLAEYVQDDRATTVERNATKIGQLKQAIEEMQEEIESLSYSEDGKQALEEYQLLLNKTMKTMPAPLGVRLKQLG